MRIILRKRITPSGQTILSFIAKVDAPQTHIWLNEDGAVTTFQLGAVSLSSIWNGNIEVSCGGMRFHLHRSFVANLKVDEEYSLEGY